MSGPAAALLSGGTRLHLQHGPIDLIIGADGARATAFDAAYARFASVLDELVAELPLLRRPVTPAHAAPGGVIAQRMFGAVAPYAAAQPVTCMAAVAGAVADTVLAAMTEAADLRRAYVNNGGDIALHLTPGTQFTTAMAHPDGSDLGRITVSYPDPVRGIATSGRLGRSLSRGIADSVTCLAASAAKADAAATLIANAVDLLGHPAIARARADVVDPASDLGALPVVTGCGALGAADVTRALARGVETAQRAAACGRIAGAALFLQGQARAVGTPCITMAQRTREHA